MAKSLRNKSTQRKTLCISTATTIDELKNLQYCRICLKEASLPISDKDVIVTITKLTDILVDQKDNFSKMMCNSCYKMLHTAIKFSKLCKKTYQILKDIEAIQLNKKPPEYNYEDDFHNEDIVEVKFEDGLASEEHENQVELKDIIKNDNEISEKNDIVKLFCSKCNLSFSSKEDLLAHRKSKEHENCKTGCKICGKLVNSRYLSNHIMQVHTKERPFVCEVCGKGFAKFKTLKRHNATHTTDLPYPCELCPYRGRFPDSVRVHMLCHTGEKPFQCSECPKKFARRSNLLAHQRKHSSHFDFQCSVCGKGYHRRRYLEDHKVMAHSGVRNHPCDICGKLFGVRHAMIKHQHKVHKTQAGSQGRVPLYKQFSKEGNVNANVQNMDE